MTDEIKTEAEKVIADTKATIAKLHADETAAQGWVKTHIAVIGAVVCFIIGIVVGHLVK